MTLSGLLYLLIMVVATFARAEGRHHHHHQHDNIEEEIRSWMPKRTLNLTQENCDHECESGHHEWVCGTNDNSYQNPCKLAKAACQAPEENIEINYTGRCVKDSYFCPDELFSADHSDRCFKIFLDEELSWRQSHGKCLNEGLVTPSQIDLNAINLRKYILDHYGEAPVWLNAIGDGRKLIWQTNKLALSNDSPLWLNDTLKVTTNHCLTLAGSSDYQRQPLRPYASHECSTPQYTLCEYVCPEGFFRMKSSYQCFRMFLMWKDGKPEKVNRAQADQICSSEGLQLATNTNDIAVPLRKYILDHFGDRSNVWLSARGGGDSGNYIWGQDQYQPQQQANQDVLRKNNTLWATGEPERDEVTHDHCLYLRVWQDAWKTESERPYGAAPCSVHGDTLCEVFGSRSGAPVYIPPTPNTLYL